MRVWLDTWLPNAELVFHSPRDPNAFVDVEFRVKDLFLPSSQAWDEVKI